MKEGDRVKIIRGRSPSSKKRGGRMAIIIGVKTNMSGDSYLRLDVNGEEHNIWIEEARLMKNFFYY